MLQNVLTGASMLTIIFWACCLLAMVGSQRFWSVGPFFVKAVRFLAPLVAVAAILKVLYYYGVDDTFDFFGSLLVVFFVGLNVLLVARASAGMTIERH